MAPPFSHWLRLLIMFAQTPLAVLVVVQSYFFQLVWPCNVDISVKELVPVVVAAARWGEK